MLKTKCILAPIENDDGTRISVMSRHTLEDGIRPHPKITRDKYYVQEKILAPPDTLVGEYYRRIKQEGSCQEEVWAWYSEQYLAHLRQPIQQEQVRGLATIGSDNDITILCIEETPEYCHRRLLAEECKELVPELKINVK